MDTAEQLATETEKWQTKLADQLDAATATTDDGEVLLENAEAYLQDAQHFRDEDDLVRAFEAVVWGWSWIEIGEQLGHIDTDTA